MPKQIAGIYVPGLGDHRSLGQDSAVKAWQKHGIHLEYHAVGWAGSEPFVSKLEQLTKRVDQLHAQYGPLALIGSSAGASAVLNAAAERPGKISCVVSICGKILNSDFRHPAFVDNPAFTQSIKALPASLHLLESAKLPILSVNSLHDGLIPTKDTVISGASVITMPMIGHPTTIGYAISLGKRRIVKFIRAQY